MCGRTCRGDGQRKGKKKGGDGDETHLIHLLLLILETPYVSLDLNARQSKRIEGSPDPESEQAASVSVSWNPGILDFWIDYQHSQMSSLNLLGK
jgi:hypothetical protein